MGKNASACVAVGDGQVGEAGEAALLSHTVGGTTQQLMALRRTGSSLCGNTGAVAVLLVNGGVATVGVLLKDTLLQAEVRPGDRVVAVVHTFPLFNQINCVRLGDLSFQLDECEFAG